MNKLALTLILTLTACVSNPKPVANSTTNEREYKASFDEVWRACQQAIISYPLKLNNIDQGLIQTTALRKGVQFKPAHENQLHSGGHRYDLNIQVLKISPKLTKVSIQKNLQVYRDFISQPEDQLSDGLEESVLLYRIAREVDIDRAIIKESKKKK